MDSFMSPAEAPERVNAGEGTTPKSPESVKASRGTELRLGLLGIALFAGILEFVPRTGIVDRRFLPPFSSMVDALGHQLAGAEFWSAFGHTMLGWAIGFAIALLLGISVGMFVGAFPIVRAATSSTIEFLRPIPSVALIPLVVLLYGASMSSTLVLVVYASFWQVLLQVLYGVQDVDPVARETARSYRFSTWARVRTVVWPSALPYIMTGFRLGASVALTLEITGELLIGSPGLGLQIAVAQSSGAVSAMYALVLITGVLGVSINLIVRMVERRALRWHPSVRGEETR